MPKVNSGTIVLPEIFDGFHSKLNCFRLQMRSNRRVCITHRMCVEHTFNIWAGQIAFWPSRHLQIILPGSIVLPERQNYGLSYNCVTIPIRLPRLEA